MPKDLLRLDDLTIAFTGDDGEGRTVVDQACLRIAAGETAALVGESGSGKTLLARSLVGLLPRGARVTGGRLRFGDRDFDPARTEELRPLRGCEIGHIFQEPLSSLNPALTVGTQLTEGLRYHRGLAEPECRRRALAMLERVHIDDAAQVMRKYPHELSGGMRQRAMIATALILGPVLLVADEPTTALDVIVGAEVLALMQQLARQSGTAVLLITHDLGAVAAVADSVNVMRHGRIVEQGSTRTILESARHPYTRELLAAVPQPRTEPAADAGAEIAGTPPVVEVRGLTVSFPRKGGGTVRALDHVSFAVARRETLAIVGESGSGKTTLSRTLAGLQRPDTGELRFNGELPAGGRWRPRPGLQLIFQDPAGSLDPRMRVADIVAEGLRFVPGGTRRERRERAARALADVKLDAAFLDRLPHQLSGGERQRVSIARALVMEPDLVLADEPVSALDLTVQRQILELLAALKRQRGFACLFVSHDLAVVEHIADRVGVLYRGLLVEIGPLDAVFARPRHPYTRRLLAAGTGLESVGPGAWRLGRRRFAADPAPAPAADPVERPGPVHYEEVAAGHLVARPAGGATA